MQIFDESRSNFKIICCLGHKTLCSRLKFKITLEWNFGAKQFIIFRDKSERHYGGCKKWCWRIENGTTEALFKMIKPCKLLSFGLPNLVASVSLIGGLVYHFWAV